MAAIPGFFGSTIPGLTNWISDEGGLYVDIDYTSAGLSNLPMVIPTLIGSIDNWGMVVSAANVTKTGARIYLKSTYEGFAPSAAYANASNWTCCYAVLGNGGGLTFTTFTTKIYFPCDHA